MATLHTTILEVDLTVVYDAEHNNIIIINVDHEGEDIYELLENYSTVIDTIQEQIDDENPIYE